jgi:hypothetical protein
MLRDLVWLGVLCVSGFVLAGLVSYMFDWGDVGWMALILPMAAWVLYVYLPPRRNDPE